MDKTYTLKNQSTEPPQINKLNGVSQGNTNPKHYHQIQATKLEFNQIPFLRPHAKIPK